MVAKVYGTEEYLLPCPFCGGKELHIESDSAPGTTFQVICDNSDCEAGGPNTALTINQAVESWNSRAAIDDVHWESLLAAQNNVIDGLMAENERLKKTAESGGA